LSLKNPKSPKTTHQISDTGLPAFGALVVFSTWYPVGVMLLVFASWPLGRMLRARAQERGK